MCCVGATYLPSYHLTSVSPKSGIAKAVTASLSVVPLCPLVVWDVDAHSRYFPEFTMVGDSLEEGLAYFQDHPAEVKRLMGTCLDHMAGLDMAAESFSFSDRL